MIGFVDSTSTANGRRTPAQPAANSHHGRAKREDGKGSGTLGASGAECPLAPTLREPRPALYNELGGVNGGVYG